MDFTIYLFHHYTESDYKVKIHTSSTERDFAHKAIYSNWGTQNEIGQWWNMIERLTL